MSMSSAILSCFVAVTIFTLPGYSLPVRNPLHKRNFEDDYMLNWDLPQLMGFKQRFEKFMDANKDGQSDFNEIKHFLRKYKPGVTDEAVETFITRRDTNGDRKIEFLPEYLVHITLPDYTPEGAREWFNLEDTNEDGIVSRDELLTIARNLGLGEPEVIQTVDGYYLSVDANGDRHLDWNEYKKLYMP